MSGAGWTSDDQNVLFTYWRAVNVQVVLACITAGADVNARNEHGYTPLYRTARYIHNPAVITALMKARANGATTNDEPEPPKLKPV